MLIYPLFDIILFFSYLGEECTLTTSKGENENLKMQKGGNKMCEEKTILKLVKDAEGKLVIHIGDMEIDETSGFLVSEELQEGVVKELEYQGFEGAVDIIKSCNRWDLD